MRLAYSIKISFRKYRRHPWRVGFSVLPLSILLMLVVILSGLDKSLDVFIQDKMIDEIAIREEIIQLDLNRRGSGSIDDPTRVDLSSDDLWSYKDSDIERIRGIDHVARVERARGLSGVWGRTDDLIAGKVIQLPWFAIVPDSLAELYGVEEFEYRAGGPIPIIIPRSFFSYHSVDLGEKDKVVVDNNLVTTDEDSPEQVRFLKNEYSNRDSLVGSTFRATMGGLPEPPEFKTTESTTNSTITYTRTSGRERADFRQKVRSVVEPYWDFDQLRSGLEVHFKIAGFNTSSEDSTVYIPIEAGLDLYQDLYDYQMAARTSRALTTESLRYEVTGQRLVDDQYILNTNAQKSGFELVARDQPSLTTISFDPTTGLLDVPGLIYTASKSSNGGSPTLSEVIDWNPERLTFPSAQLIISLDDASWRSEVLEDLSAMGFVEANSAANVIDVFRDAQNIVAIFFRIALIGLVAISSLVLMVSTWRQVAESRREIGIYRALGATRLAIGGLYVIYTSLQTVIGLVVGLLLGLAVLWLAADWVAGVVSMTGGLDFVGQNFIGGVDLKLTAGDLHYINWPIMVALGVGLMGLSLLVSMLPAWQASRVSPVEAMREIN